METGNEKKFYADINKIARALEEIIKELKEIKEEVKKNF